MGIGRACTKMNSVNVMLIILPYSLENYFHTYSCYSNSRDSATAQNYNSHHCELPLDWSRKLHQSSDDVKEPSVGSAMFSMPVSSSVDSASSQLASPINMLMLWLTLSDRMLGFSFDSEVESPFTELLSLLVPFFPCCLSSISFSFCNCLCTTEYLSELLVVNCS